MNEQEESGALVAAIGTGLAVFFVGGLMHVLQMTSFYGLWLGIGVGAIAAGMATKFSWSLTENDSDNLSTYGSLTLFLSASSTSWFWDEAGYCAIQTEAERVEFGPQSWQDVFTNTSRYDYLISDVSKRCIETGAYEYTNSYEITLMAFSLILGFFFLCYIFIGVMADRESNIEQARQSIPASQRTTADRIKSMEESVENASRCTQWYGLCANIDEMKRMRPPAKDCTDFQLLEIMALGSRMSSEVQRLTDGETKPIASQLKKVAQMEEKLVPIIKEIAKRGLE
jgi:hypothetical protein